MITSRETLSWRPVLLVALGHLLAMIGLMAWLYTHPLPVRMMDAPGQMPANLVSAGEQLPANAPGAGAAPPATRPEIFSDALLSDLELVARSHGLDPDTLPPFPSMLQDLVATGKTREQFTGEDAEQKALEVLTLHMQVLATEGAGPPPARPTEE